MSPAEFFETLRALAAFAGLQAVRTDPADGPVRYFVIQGQTVRGVDLDKLQALVKHPAH